MARPPLEVADLIRAAGDARTVSCLVPCSTVSARLNTAPSRNSIRIAPASTATTGGHVQTALPDARADPRLRLLPHRERASGKALAFVATNPTGDQITSGLPVYSGAITRHIKWLRIGKFSVSVIT